MRSWLTFLLAICEKLIGMIQMMSSDFRGNTNTRSWKHKSGEQYLTYRWARSDVGTKRRDTGRWDALHCAVLIVRMATHSIHLGICERDENTITDILQFPASIPKKWHCWGFSHTIVIGISAYQLMSHCVASCLAARHFPARFFTTWVLRIFGYIFPGTSEIYPYYLRNR